MMGKWGGGKGILFVAASYVISAKCKKSYKNNQFTVLVSENLLHYSIIFIHFYFILDASIPTKD